MSRLIQLPDGSWVRPEVVNHVRAFHGGHEGGERIEPRLEVVTARTRFDIYYESYDEAVAVRDVFAAQVNAALEAARAEATAS